MFYYCTDILNCVLFDILCSYTIDLFKNNRVKSVKFRHQVNSDTHLQTVEIQMKRLLMSHLIRIFTVCQVNLFFIPITEL